MLMRFDLKNRTEQNQDVDVLDAGDEEVKKWRPLACEDPRGSPPYISIFKRFFMTSFQ